MSNYLNLDPLREAVQYIKDHPEQHDQTAWGKRSPSCGTTMCLGGHLGVLNGWEPLWLSLVPEGPQTFHKMNHQRCNRNGGFLVTDVAIMILDAEENFEAQTIIHDLFREENTMDDIEDHCRRLAKLNGENW